MHHVINFYQAFKGESLSYGRTHAKKYVRKFLLIFLIGAAASSIAASFSPGENIHNAMSFFSDMLGVFVSVIMGVATTKIYLDVVHGKWINFNHFQLNTTAKRQQIGKRVWGYVLYSLIVLGWILLLIIPGIYFAIRLSFRQYFLLDKNMTIKQSLRASRDKTKGHEWQLVGVGFLSLWITLLWALALLVGLLRAVPTVKIAYTDLYKKIAG